MVYVPYWYRADNTAGSVVRTKQDPSQMANAIRRTIWSIDPAVAVPYRACAGWSGCRFGRDTTL